MLNLLNTEFYKLFHSRYFWGIAAFNLFLSSVLLLDSIGETSSLFFASLYNVPILYFLAIVFSALFVGNDFGQRTLQSYIFAGHNRGQILLAKLVSLSNSLHDDFSFTITGTWIDRRDLLQRKFREC